MQETSILSTGKKVNPYILFFLLCVGLYLPASFFRSPFAPDEYRNLYIANNITTLRDYFLPNFVDGFYHEKPPLYFWILKAFLGLRLPNMLTLPILFNAIVSWIILSANYSFLKKEGAESIGFYSSLILATTGLFYGMNVLARMDILFLCFLYLGIYAFWLSCKKKSIAYLLISAVLSFCAVFTKGAFGIIIPLVVEVGISVFLKSKRAFFKALAANVISAILIFAWLFSFSQLRPDYFSTMFYRQTVGRGINPQSHLEPFYYYLVYIFPVLLPWSFLLIGYFLNLNRKKMPPWEKMYLFWFVAGFLMLSLIRTKLPMYLLLLTIPGAALVGKFICHGRESLKNKLFVLMAGFFLLSWVIAFVLFLPKEQLPAQAFLSLPLILSMFFCVFRRPLEKKLRNFFISWFILLQMLNLVYLPLASNASDYKRILDYVKITNGCFDKIYVREKNLLVLNLYSIRPLLYLENKETICQEPSFLLITKESDFPCATQKIGSIDEISLLTKQ